MCECTRDGVWGSELCCFDDYYASDEEMVNMYQSDWYDFVAPNWLPGCDVDSPGYESSVAGPETQESLLTLTLGRLTPTLTLTLSLTLPLTRRAAPSTVACPARPSATAASARTRRGCTPAARARWS